MLEFHLTNLCFSSLGQKPLGFSKRLLNPAPQQASGLDIFKPRMHHYIWLITGDNLGKQKLLSFFNEPSSVLTVDQTNQQALQMDPNLDKNRSAPGLIFGPQVQQIF